MFYKLTPSFVFRSRSPRRRTPSPRSRDRRRGGAGGPPSRGRHSKTPPSPYSGGKRRGGSPGPGRRGGHGHGAGGRYSPPPASYPDSRGRPPRDGRYSPPPPHGSTTGRYASPSYPANAAPNPDASNYTTPAGANASTNNNKAKKPQSPRTVSQDEYDMFEKYIQ